jgi:hypothetical protein
MVHQEFSEEGRKARFEQWENYGVERLKSDLQADPYRRVGSGPVQSLAWEFVRMKEAERSKAATAAMGLSKSPALDALGRHSWSTSLEQALSREGPGTLKYALRSSTEAIESDTSSSTALTKPVLEETSRKPSGEIFTLKPTVYGVGVDLKELARRFRAWLARRRSSAP